MTWWSDRLLVTVFSDASFKDHTAGWGFWFKSRFTQGKGSGSAPAASVPHAELMGILAAMRAASLKHDGQRISLLVQCDSMAALGVLLQQRIGQEAKTSPQRIQWRKNLSRPELNAVLAFREGWEPVPVYLKHVKGHVGTGDARSWVNDLTDQLARKARTTAARAVSCNGRA